MDKELQNKLFEKYPTIFQNHTKSPRESCMAFGIECGDGWYNIIDALCMSLLSGYSSLIDTDRFDNAPGQFEYKSQDFQITADQVKEKFGVLRFYYTTTPTDKFLIQERKFPNTGEHIRKMIFSYYSGIIHMAEAMSSVTCELTGLPGVRHVKGGWIKTLNTEKGEELGYTEIKKVVKSI